MARLERQRLPVEEAALGAAHAAARAAALAKFERERFGSQVGPLRAALEAAIEREYRWGEAWWAVCMHDARLRARVLRGTNRLQHLTA